MGLVTVATAAGAQAAPWPQHAQRRLALLAALLEVTILASAAQREA